MKGILSKPRERFSSHSSTASPNARLSVLFSQVLPLRDREEASDLIGQFMLSIKMRHLALPYLVLPY
jgi:hypothetical protein